MNFVQLPKLVKLTGNQPDNTTTDIFRREGVLVCSGVYVAAVCANAVLTYVLGSKPRKVLSDKVTLLLSMADGLWALLGLLLYADELVVRVRVSGYAQCVMDSFIVNLFMSYSWFLTAFIAISRYIAVCRPYSYISVFNNRTLNVCLSAMLLLALAMNMTYFLQCLNERENVLHFFDSISDPVFENLAPSIALTCGAIMVTCYSFIGWHMSRMRTTLRVASTCNVKMGESRRAELMFWSVCTLWILLTVPYTLYVFSVQFRTEQSVVKYEAQVTASVLFVMQQLICLLNPLVVYSLNGYVQRRVNKALRRCAPKRPLDRVTSEDAGDTSRTETLSITAKTDL